MPSIVITSTNRLISFEFNDRRDQLGYEKMSIRKDQVTPIKEADNHVEFNVINRAISWKLAHNGGPRRMKVDTVDGVEPVDVPDLYQKILDILG